jgi:hypothetical protein
MIFKVIRTLVSLGGGSRKGDLPAHAAHGGGSRGIGPQASQRSDLVAILRDDDGAVPGALVY